MTSSVDGRKIGLAPIYIFIAVRRGGSEKNEEGSGWDRELGEVRPILTIGPETDSILFLPFA